MKTIQLLVFSMLLASFTTPTSQATSTPEMLAVQKEYFFTFYISPLHPSYKREVATITASLFGVSVKNIMKAFNEDGKVILKSKLNVSKDEAASIKTAIEAAGAEVEVK